MKKLLSVLLIVVLLLLPCALAEASNTSESEPLSDSSWYELSEDQTVLTVRLTDFAEDDLQWHFEISIPEAFELLTQEVYTDESENPSSTMTYVASFGSFASQENHVSLILTYAAEAYEAPAASRVLEMDIHADNTISFASVLERNSTAEWLEYDVSNQILTLRLPQQSGEGYAWDLLILDPEILELITCDTEQGFIGSFTSFTKEAGRTELILSYGRTDSDKPKIIYTVNLSVDENGGIIIHWADSFSIFDVPSAETEA